MMDLSTGQMVDTEVINSPRMESYHAWSSNGKWILYSTKKFDGRYTRLMMAYWDGTAFHKPFLLPQQNPEDNTTTACRILPIQTASFLPAWHISWAWTSACMPLATTRMPLQA